jgi:hypothetical protein
MSRVDSPADVQWARALMSVIAGLVLTCGILHPGISTPGVGMLPAEVRALAVLPCLVMYVVRGE